MIIQLAQLFLANADLIDMGAPARFHDHVEFGLARRQMREYALVGDVDDVRARGANHLRHAREHAGLVVDLDAQHGLTHAKRVRSRVEPANGEQLSAAVGRCGQVRQPPLRQVGAAR